MVLNRPFSLNIRWLGTSLFILTFLGVALFVRFIYQYDQKYKMEDLLSKGNSLASLLALHSLDDFNGDRRDIFLRSLKEYISSEGLVYCLVHDRKGRTLLSMIPHNLASRIPNDIEEKSLYSMGLTKQVYEVSGRQGPIYEFSKPIFEKGRRTGIIRLGFNAPFTAWFSLERISLLAMIALFVFASLLLAYNAASTLLRPLRKLYDGTGENDENKGIFSPVSLKNAGANHIIEEIEKSFLKLKDSLSSKVKDNTEMSIQLGVVNYEKKQIAKIIDSLNFGVLITDTQDNVSYSNDFVHTLFGVKKNETLNRSVKEVLPDESLQGFISKQEGLGQSLNTSFFETEFPHQAPGKVFRLSLSFIKDDDDAVVSKMITVRDITNEKSTEKATRDFIANVAHEFLTPLTTIKSYNEMLMDDEVDDKEMQKEFYNTISEETNRLTRLIQNLLSISKIEMGALSLKRGLVKTDWLANDCIAAVETNAEKKQITLEKKFPDNFPAIMGDKELLKTAVINLLGNAVKYSPENASVTFSLFEQRSMVCIEVSDTGYGISEEDLPHIFEKFYRSKNPEIRENTGSGLGLAMTADIIQLHGGEIDVQSEIGVGTRFTVIIPKEECQIGKQ